MKSSFVFLLALGDVCRRPEGTVKLRGREEMRSGGMPLPSTNPFSLSRLRTDVYTMTL